MARFNHERLHFSIGTLLGVVFLCACFLCGYINGRSNERNKLHEVESELRSLDQQERDLERLSETL